MKYLRKLILLSAVLCIFYTANAQFVQNSSQTDFNTVREIRKKALWLDWSDRWIKVQGAIVEQFGEHYFWFEDKTGRIKLEIKPKHMPDFQFNNNTGVVINGEIDYHLFGHTEIEVKKIELYGK